MHATELDRGWRFRRESGSPGFWRPHAPGDLWRPAEVPGHVHLDLFRNGLIADPFSAQHEGGCQWVDEQDWTYRLEFSWRPREGCPRRVLRFEGLDTVCAIVLNDETIARHDSMFVPLEIDVTERLREGLNALEVRFESAVRTGMARRKEYFEAEGVPWDAAIFDERAFVRKMQCASGWDWGPRLVSCGIWKPVSLLEFESRIVRFEVRQEALEGGRFRVWTETEVEGPAALETRFDGEAVQEEWDGVVEAPQLWWPNGEGDPHLYPASARVRGGEWVDRYVGLRTVRLLREPDAFGESFEFEVNGRRLWIRGANWIPGHALPSQHPAQSPLEAVSTSQELNFNMLRVWGGGLYESDEFYDACDLGGILVWQDFPFACSHYPDDEAARAALRVEAESAIRRLRSRACLALWCGNNENQMMVEGRWGGDKSPPRDHGAALFQEVLPGLLAQLDPDRPYVPTSPVGSPPDREECNADGFGDQHMWDVWHGRGDWIHYRESGARFCSEFGFASSCSLSQWRDVIAEPTQWHHESSTVRWHDRTGKPWETFRGFVELHYPESTSLEEWVYFSQLNQRDALRCAIEHFRSQDACRGALIWQLNDCWPAQSWAVRDFSGLLKPAGFELKRLYAPTLASLRVDEGWARVRVAHDGPSVRRLTVSVAAMDTLDGRPLTASDAHLELAPGTRVAAITLDLAGCEPDRTVVCAWIDGDPDSRTFRTLAEPKAMRWTPPRYAAEWRDGELVVEVEGLAYDLVLGDPSDAFNVRWGAELTGRPALCSASESLRFPCAARPSLLELRSLAGFVELQV